MKTILNVFFVLTFSAFIGGYSAWHALKSEHFFNAIIAGQWQSTQLNANNRAQPYERARLALHSQAQLGLGEGLRFVATKDDQGAVLRTNCTYQLTGPAPKARVFTLFAADLKGEWLTSGIGLNDFHHSHSVGYSLEDHVSINVSSKLSFGDWLYVPNKTPEGQPYQLVLKLYDTSIGALSDYTDIEMPKIQSVSCQ